MHSGGCTPRFANKYRNQVPVHYQGRETAKDQQTLRCRVFCWKIRPLSPGEWGTPLFALGGHVPLNRLWFQGVQSCKQGLQFQYLASTELCSSAAVVPQSESTEMWSSAAPFHQTNILGLCYSFGKTLYKQPTDTEINTLDQIAALIETDHTI